MIDQRHVGSDFDDFLRDECLLDDAEAVAKARILLKDELSAVKDEVSALKLCNSKLHSVAESLWLINKELNSAVSRIQSNNKELNSAVSRMRESLSRLKRKKNLLVPEKD